MFSMKIKYGFQGGVIDCLPAMCQGWACRQRGALSGWNQGSTPAINGYLEMFMNFGVGLDGRESLHPGMTHFKLGKQYLCKEVCSFASLGFKPRAFFYPESWATNTLVVSLLAGVVVIERGWQWHGPWHGQAYRQDPHMNAGKEGPLARSWK